MALGAYIAAIIARELLVAMFGSHAVATRATELRRTFRTMYDGLRGPFSKSDSEDFFRAIGRL